MTTPHLIALDWGTSNLRASLLNHDGSIIETRSAPGGVMAVKDRQFSAALLSLCDDWINQFACPLIASGMVGSRQGWKEAPYLDCPASLLQAAQALISVEVTPQQSLHIVPGLRNEDRSGAFDVMRGEETQIWGAGMAPHSCCVLPGTHSKWAWTGSHGQVQGFATYMTGELYGLLTKHGILGRLMVFGHARPRDFEAGVRRGLLGHPQASHTIFAARTAGLMGTVSPEGLPDYLSGMLIGIEIAGAKIDLDAAMLQSGVTLIGDDDLCDRYSLALEISGLSSRRGAADATTSGLWQISQAAGLVASSV
jgi:2-dehydro-3-deoxygalactonokinase